MKNKYVSLTLLFCVCLLVSANQISAKDTWINVRSKNFNLIGNASEKEIRGVATKLEQFRETFRLLFPRAKFNSAIETNVVIFKSDSSYNPFKPKRADGKINKQIAGYFQPGEDLNYITLSTEGEKEDTYGTIFHEYVHYLLDTNFGKSEVPPWFNEGLAEFYQTFKIEDDQKVSLGLLQYGHLQLLQQNKLIPLKTFFEIDNYSLHQNANHSRSIFYAQAWALIHYLIQGNKGANNTAMNNFLSLVMKNVEPEKAFQQAFQRDYAAMEKELTKYVNQSKYMGASYTFEKKLVFDTEMRSVPLSEAQANAYLGDLLYHTNEYADAEKYLQNALALDANSVMANTSYGLVKMRQRKFGEAKNFLEKALASDAKNHYVHYSYAYIVSREGMDESGYTMGYATEKADAMRRALQKAIQLKPDFTESYRLLAFVNLVNNENLDESLALLKKGLAYQPGNQEYALLEAQILLRQEKFTEAKTIAEKLAKTAEEQYMRANAESILRSINQYETAKNNYQKQIDEINSNNASAATAPTLVRRSAVSEAEREKFEAERAIDAMNRAIKKPETNEKQILGYFEKITCPNGTVAYTVKTGSETIALTSKDFQSLNLVSLSPESMDYQVGCDADLKTAPVVVTYRPATAAKSKSKGDVTAIYFVSKNFRLKTEAEIAEADAKQDVLIEDDMKNQMEDGIKNALRKPEAGEQRELAYPEKIECSGRSIFFIVKSGEKVLKLKTDAPQNVRIASFTQIGSMQFGCGVKFPQLPAVVTFRPSADAKDKVSGEIVAVEFVPEGFKLD